MKIHQVKQCCCGCTLETGTRIIGWLETVCGIIIAISGIGLIAVGNKNGGAGVSIGYIVMGIIYAALGLTLLIGAAKRRAHLLNIWIVVALIVLGLYVLGTVIQVVTAMIAGQFGPGIGVLIGGVIGTLLSYYFIMVVSSFRSEIMAGNNGV